MLAAIVVLHLWCMTSIPACCSTRRSARCPRTPTPLMPAARPAWRKRTSRSAYDAFIDNSNREPQNVARLRGVA